MIIYVLLAVLLLCMVVIAILSINLRKKCVRHENLVGIKSNQQAKLVSKPRVTIQNHDEVTIQSHDEDSELYHQYMYVPDESHDHPEFENEK